MFQLIRLDFVPTVGAFDLSVRLETLALAAVIFIMLIVAGLSAGRARAAAGGPVGEPGNVGLRRGDLILMAFGAVPGALAGGRLGYGLIHLDYYQTHTDALLDPGRGGLELTLAVVLGTASALAVARLLGAPANRWLHLAAMPLLLGLGLGKLAMVAGGSGQGQFSTDQWATAYVGPGQWGSLSPATAALPSQVVEGLFALLVLALLLAVPFLLRLRLERWRRIARPIVVPGREWWLLAGYRRYVTAVAIWAAVRFIAAFTWRDAHVFGPLGVEQLLLVGVVAGGAGMLAADRERARRSAAALAAHDAADSPAADPPDSLAVDPPDSPAADPPAVDPPGDPGAPLRGVRSPKGRGRSLRAAPEYSRDVPESEVQGVADEPRIEPAGRLAARRARSGRSRPGAG